MNNLTVNHARVRVVRRIFEDQDFGNVELLEGWNGEELEELAEILSKEEFQTLLDEIRANDAGRGN